MFHLIAEKIDIDRFTLQKFSNSISISIFNRLPECISIRLRNSTKETTNIFDERDTFRLNKLELLSEQDSESQPFLHEDGYWRDKKFYSNHFRKRFVSRRTCRLTAA